MPEPIGELHPWAVQMSASLAELARRVERLDGTVDSIEQQVDGLEARLEALDASYVRHQGSNEEDFRRAGESVDRVGTEPDNHLGAHWRSGR